MSDTTATPEAVEPAVEQPDAAPIVDADVVDEKPAAAPGTELVMHTGRELAQARIIAGDDPDEIIANATKVANSLKALVEAQGFAVNMGGRKPHLEIAAWQAVGVLLGALGGEPLHPETIWSRPTGEPTTYHVHEKKKKFGKIDGKRAVIEEREIDYDATGVDWEARVAVKTAAGVVVGVSEAMCSRAEASWMQKPDPALKSMAETRAASRAFRASLGWVVAIAGYNPTPAEEMPPEQAQADGPPYGPAATEAQVANARAAMAYLLDPENPLAPDHNAIGVILNAIEKAAKGYLPHFALAQITRVAAAVRQRRDGNGAAVAEQPAEEAAQTLDAGLPGDDPAGETEEERADRERAEAVLADEQARTEAGDE